MLQNMTDMRQMMRSEYCMKMRRFSYEQAMNISLNSAAKLLNSTKNNKRDNKTIPYLKAKIFTYNYESSRSKICKLARFILILVIFRFWTSLILKYKKYDKYLIFEQKSVDELLFPAITFCNNGKYFQPIGNLDVLRSWAMDTKIYEYGKGEDEYVSNKINELEKTWEEKTSSRENSEILKNNLDENKKLKACLEQHEGNHQVLNADGQIIPHIHLDKKEFNDYDYIHQEEDEIEKGYPISYYEGRYTKFMDTWGWNLTQRDDVKNNGQNIDMIFAKFNDQSLKRSDFKKIYTREGVCYTFNAENKFLQNNPKYHTFAQYTKMSDHRKKNDGRTYLHYVRRVGPTFGLNLIFNVNNENYVYDLMEINSNAGIKFTAHSPYDPPNIEEKFEVVGVGKRAYVETSLINENYLYQPWGHCDENFEKMFENETESELSRYSKLSCSIECKKKVHKYICGCLPFYFFNENSNIRDYSSNIKMECKPETVLKCSLIVEKAVDKLIHNQCHGKPLCTYEMLLNKTCDTKKYCKNFCNCPLACETAFYPTKVSYTTFPVLNIENNSFKIFYRKASNTNVSGEYLRKNLVGLKVYFNDLSVKTGKEYKSYDQSQLMGDIGGSLGLFTGYSILKCFEFLSCFFNKINKILMLRKN